MSQIGNYIHRTFAGYVQEGTTENGAFSEWKQDIYENILPPSIPKADLLQKEAMLNEYINANKVKGSTQQQQAVWKYIDQYLQNELDIAGKGLVSVRSNSGGSVSVTKDPHLKELRQSFKELNEYYQTLIKTKENEKEIFSKLQKLAQSIEKYARENNKLIPNFTGKTTYVGLRDAVDTYLSYPSFSMFKGKLGESLAVLLDDEVELTAETSCDEMIKKLETTRKKVQTGQKTIKRHIGKKTIYNAEGTDVTLDYQSQSKADLRISFGGQKIGINVKNYYLGQEAAIHVHGGGQLTYLFKDNPDFLNHFINLFVNHSGIEIPEDFTTKKRQMVQDFSANALAYALAGKEKAEKSSIFMVIGRGAGANHSTSVKLFSIRDLFKALKAQGFKGVTVTVGGQEVAENAILFNQPLDAKDKKTRLSAVINDAKSKVLSVSVLSSALGF